MTVNKPRMSIGLPVFNGESHIKESISSILAQTYQDFELIISDNASTDRTSQICREYAQTDERVTYYRSKKNLGAVWNFNKVFELSSGVYFKWAASDDVIAPEFLSRCVNVLEGDPSIVLCHSKTALINELGELTGTHDFGTITNSLKPHVRFGEILNRKGFPWMVFGVFRRDVLRKTNVFEGYIGSDWTLLAEISLLGQIKEIPDRLFFRRSHSNSYTNKNYAKHVRVHDYRTESLWWTGNRKRPLIVLPHWKICSEFFKSARRVHMKSYERRLCYKEIIKWICGEGKGLMKWDLVNEFDFWRTKLNKIQDRKVRTP